MTEHHSAGKPPATEIIPQQGGRFRWKPALGILLIATVAQTTCWFALAGNRTFQVMSTLYIVPTTLFLLILWWTHLSGLSRKTRLLGLGSCFAAVALFFAVVKIDGFYGDMVPVLVWRWADSPAGSWEEESPAENPKATANGAVEPLEVGPEDWPGFRGPERNGVVREATIRHDWKRHPPEEVWRRPVGQGWSSFAVADGYAFTHEQRDEKETVVCYDAETGEQLWTHSNSARFSETLGGDGPRATPTVYDSRVYALGATGILDCLDASTGRLQWSRNILDDADAENLHWGMAGSPLVYQNKVVVNPGGEQGKGVMAYNRLTGEQIWANGDHPAGYAAPRLETIDGVPQVLIFGGDGLAGYHAATGEELWWTPWETQQGINVAQPIVRGRRVFLSSGYGQGSMLFELQRENGTWSRPKSLWDRPNIRLTMKFNGGVDHDGYVYALDEDILTCVDFRTGRQQWKGGRYGYGQILLLGDFLLVQAQSGEVVLLEATPEKHREIGRMAALDDKTWNHPAFWRGRLLVRNAKEAACYDLRPVKSVVKAESPN